MNPPVALAASPPQKNVGAAARPMGSSQTRGCRSIGANPWLARVAGDPLLLQIGDGIRRPIQISWFAFQPSILAHRRRRNSCETPEDSRHTSIYARLAPQANTFERAAIDAKAATPEKVSPGDTADSGSRERRRSEGELAGLPRAPLMPFDATARLDAAIPFGFDDYLDLVDSLGRCVHPHKRGFIREGTPKLLDRLGIDAEGFIAYAAHFLKAFGTPSHLVELAAARQVKFLRGMKAARQAFERKAA